ncbi:hypothetical protein Taro_016060 [Colocasia esculenta]|uniref:Uncharacterized protein n=1 Tax=Colocasia esculenta TaxID=4460 RepID=A0A843UMV9_COLES|nr:hypothetical protein [Colocasia esculenta]
MIPINVWLHPDAIHLERRPWRQTRFNFLHILACLPVHRVLNNIHCVGRYSQTDPRLYFLTSQLACSDEEPVESDGAGQE